ncbi:hypothetical protein NHX12_009820 [Muraenolepis orangiensis]|uniref:Coiled-coil alpha-helical rod protein 1 n=1 Tax=Muraenolepis orangiensis TaxID=630683 RepID=A0A9Q0DIC2_9TELE|nr:hypothetical protein NHX12_009820 [Muraenolepis orangiensis]
MAKQEPLRVPTDFTTPRDTQRDLMPPSHFQSAAPLRGVLDRAAAGSWSSGPRVSGAEISVFRAQEEVLQLRKENQRLMMLLQGDTSGGRSRCTDSTGRQGAELETLRCDLGQTRARLDQVRLELQQNLQENQKISSQKEFEEEIGRLRKEAAQSREEIENLQNRHQTELQQLNSSRASDQEAVLLACDRRQRSLDATATEMLQLRSGLEAVTEERDILREQLGQARQAFEGQSTTLQTLRTYIGQLSPKRAEEEKMAEALQKLSREKEAQEKTADLLSVRLKCVNEILALQEHKLLNKTSSDPLLSSRGGCESLGVLRLWRDRVYSLCVQLRTQELELKTEREKNTSGHHLDDKLAQLHLKEVATQSVKEDLAAAVRDNTELRSWKHHATVELGAMKEGLQRFGAAFEVKLAGVDKSREQLDVLSQRLAIAKRRIHTIQGLLVRRQCLQKVHQDSRQTAQEDQRVKRLQEELHLLTEEREELSQELRRTPELIDQALLKEQQAVLDKSRAALTEALSSQEEAQRSERETRARLEEVRSQLLQQQEESQQAEVQVSERLREADVQVNTARREHTKAVTSLRQFDRQVTREREQGRRDQQVKIDQSQKEVGRHRVLTATDLETNTMRTVVEEVMEEVQDTTTGSPLGI